MLSFTGFVFSFAFSFFDPFKDGFPNFPFLFSGAGESELPEGAPDVGADTGPVSYTHLDVYKRQHLAYPMGSW